jgi:uncharacterized membrane protein YfcA
MAPRERLIVTLTGAVAGFFGGLFGVGGGIVLVPLLAGRLRFTQHQAHGTSLAVILITALSGAAVYAANGNVDVITGVLAGLASTATAPLGAWLASRLSGNGLRRAFSIFLVCVAVRLFWMPGGGDVARVAGMARLAADAGIGAAVGLLAGFMGVGGGIIAVPTFRLLLGMPQQLAQGTSLLVILGAAGSGAFAHSRRGNILWAPVPWLGLGAVVAVPLASWWVQRLPQVLLVRAFAVFLAVNAVYGWRAVSRATQAPPGAPPS